MKRFFIVAKRPTIVINTIYLPGDCLKTVKNHIRSWANEKQARKYLNDNIQAPGEMCGWVVTNCPEIHKS